MFRKVLLMWSSMPIFSFLGYTLTDLFRKPDNWRQIYKQTSSTFYTSNDVPRRRTISTSYQGCEIEKTEAATEVQKQSPEVFCKKRCSQKFRKLHRKKPALETFLNKVADLQLANYLKRHSNTSAFLRRLRNF